jgi:anti-sigma factor RsiW
MTTMERPVTCTGVADELLAYHLDLVEDDARQAIDEHLLGCQECLRAFLQLKHQARGASELRPGSAARQRLRDEVARTFRPPALARVRAWLARPVPLYQSLAVASAAVLLAVATPGVLRRAASQPPPVAGPRVDTARVTPAAASLY